MKPGYKVGLLGGTFDPIHLGHIHCALVARDTLGLDEVLIIPAARPPFKLENKLASIEDRLEMCKLAVLGEDGLAVSDIEARRQGASYTIDTVEELLGENDLETPPYFIIGSDAFLTLPKWRRAQELVKLVDFAVLMRSSDSELSVNQVASEMEARLHTIPADRMDVSSSEIRKRLRTCADVSKFLPQRVAEYIEEKGLYHD